MKKAELTSPIQFNSTKAITPKLNKLSPISQQNQMRGGYNFSTKNLNMKYQKNKQNQGDRQTYFNAKSNLDNKVFILQKDNSKAIINDMRINRNMPNYKSNSYKNINSQSYKTDQKNNQFQIDINNKIQGNFKSSYMTKRVSDDKMSEKKYKNRNSYDRLSKGGKGLSLNSNNGNKIGRFEEKEYEYIGGGSNNKIDKLNQKLSSLQDRIHTMKKEMEKKKEEKKNLLQRDFKQRKQRDLQRKQRQKSGNQSMKNDQQGDCCQKSQIQSSDKELKQSRLLQQVVTQIPKQNKQLQYFLNNPYSPRHNIYYVSEIIRAYKQKKSLSRQHLLTSLNIIKTMSYTTKIPTNQQVQNKKLKLTQHSFYKNKKTVVFDLDQTLIHCNDSIKLSYDFKINITFPNGQIVEAGINIRPYALQILKNLSQNFQIIVFTASHSCYANLVIDYLDPQNKYIQHRLFREHCYHSPQGVYVKDLRIIPRNLKDMILIDNAAYSYFFQLQNGIPIIPFYEGSKDYQLKALQGYIQRLGMVKDVRSINNNTFKLNKYVNYDQEQSLVRELYIQG